MVDKSKTNKFGAGALNPDGNQEFGMPEYDYDEVGLTERLYKGSQDIKRVLPDNPDTGEYIGVVLRVDGETHKTPSNGILFTPQNIASEGYLNQSRVVGVKLLQLRVRIPKIHTCLIEPETNPSIFQNHPDNEIIEMYPLFLAKEENMPIPNPGDPVWVKLTNKNGKFSGIYTGLIKQDAFITEESRTKTPQKAYEDNCPGNLSTIPAAAPAFSSQTVSSVNDLIPKSVQMQQGEVENTGNRTACKYGRLLGARVSGNPSSDNMSSSTGGYQSYKSVPTKVEIFTSIPCAPPGWNIGKKKIPSGLVENRVRKFAFDALPLNSPLLESLPQGGVKVHKLLASRLRAMNKYWSDTVLSKVTNNKALQKKLTGEGPLELWGTTRQSDGARQQHYENNYALYKAKMLIEKHTGPGNKHAYTDIRTARNRKAFQSAHETGLAIDFRTNGQYTANSPNQITRMNNWAFQWLINHAWLFGLYPYSAETWHWELLPTREAWETGRDFVNIYDPSSGIWVGKLPDSEQQLSTLYEKNPLLKEAVELGVELYESIPYRSIGIKKPPGFPDSKWYSNPLSDPLYELNNPSEPIHFPYAVMVKETLKDNGPDDGLLTNDSRFGWNDRSERRFMVDDGTTFERKLKVAIPPIKEITAEQFENASMEPGSSTKVLSSGGTYYKYKPSAFYLQAVGSKKPRENVTVEIANNYIRKDIYFGWSKNNE